MAELKKGTLSLSYPAGEKKGAGSSPAGRVRQSFSHGKSKIVTVEVKKKKFFKSSASPDSKQAVTYLKQGDLTSEEMQTRLQAVKDAIKESKELEELRLKREKELEEQRKIEEKLRLEQEQKAREEELRAKQEEELRAKEELAKSEKPKESANAPEKRPNIGSNERRPNIGTAERRPNVGVTDVKSGSVADVKPVHKKFSHPQHKYFDSSEEEETSPKLNSSKKTLTIKKDIK